MQFSTFWGLCIVSFASVEFGFVRKQYDENLIREEDVFFDIYQNVWEHILMVPFPYFTIDLSYL